MQKDLTTSIMHMAANQLGHFEQMFEHLKAKGEIESSVTPDQVREFETHYGKNESWQKRTLKLICTSWHQWVSKSGTSRSVEAHDLWLEGKVRRNGCEPGVK